jgi:uncharacterized protein (UPF0335 family)
MALLGNSIEAKAAPFLSRIENLHADLESKKGAYMASCKVVRDELKEVYGEAKEAGVAPKALKGVVKNRQLQRKIDAISDGLDIDEVSTYEQLCEALGDFGETELGKAVLETAKAKAASGSTAPGRPKGTKGKKAAAPSEAQPPDADAVAARTAEELAEPIDEIDRPFAERHADQKARDAASFGTTEPTHTVVQ